MKDATIMLRVTSEQKLAIKRMARKKGLTITEFMLLSMMKSINKCELENNINKHLEISSDDS